MYVSRTCYRAWIGKSAYTICYVICKLNDFRNATCPAAVAGFPIDGPDVPEAKNGIDGKVSPKTRVSERADRRQQLQQQQVLGCRYLS